MTMGLPEKKFKRDGARYICLECKKSFFTKVEVEACFDSHRQPQAQQAATPSTTGVKPKP